MHVVSSALYTHNTRSCTGPSRNPFKVLGVGENATTEEIKRAYREKVLKYHPDTSQDKHKDRKLIEVTEAYNKIKNPSDREAYREEFTSPFQHASDSMNSGDTPFHFGGFSRHRDKHRYSFYTDSTEAEETRSETKVDPSGTIITKTVYSYNINQQRLITTVIVENTKTGEITTSSTVTYTSTPWSKDKKTGINSTLNEYMANNFKYHSFSILSGGQMIMLTVMLTLCLNLALFFFVFLAKIMFTLLPFILLWTVLRFFKR